MVIVYVVIMLVMFCDEEKKYDGCIVIEIYLVGVRKNDIVLWK